MNRTFGKVAAAAMAGGFIFGCGGHQAAAPVAEPGSTQFSAMLDADRLARLASGPADTAQVTGKLSIAGMTLVTDTGTPVIGDALNSILIWIVDPGDDILSAGSPDAQGRFSVQVPHPPSRAVLVVRCHVQADLDNNGTGGDLLQERFALDLATGKEVLANIDLREQTGLQPGAPAGAGTPPQIIVAQLSSTDASGKHSEARASDYTAGTQVVDVDGDGKFDALRDLTLADANTDGLPDATAPLYASTDAYSRVYGLVTRVDEFQRTMDVLVRDSATATHSVTVAIDPQAAVELYLPQQKDAAAKFAQLNLGQFMVGRNVYADGYFTDGATQRALTVFALNVLQ